MTTSTEAGGEHVDPVLPLGGASGVETDLRRRHFGPSIAVGQQLTDAYASYLLGQCAQFLNQLVMITSGVMDSLGLGQVRKIVAEEMPVPPGVIDEDGKWGKPAQAPERDHRKNPRGRKHPVVTLLQMAVQATRLLIKLTCGTHPGAHNKETLEQKQLREEMQQQERSFNSLLKGRV